jgi:hypothetical protein
MATCAAAKRYIAREIAQSESIRLVLRYFIVLDGDRGRADVPNAS